MGSPRRASRMGLQDSSPSPKRRPRRLDVENIENSLEARADTPTRQALGDVTPGGNAQACNPTLYCPHSVHDAHCHPGLSTGACKSGKLPRVGRCRLPCLKGICTLSAVVDKFLCLHGPGRAGELSQPGSRQEAAAHHLANKDERQTAPRARICQRKADAGHHTVRHA